MKKILILILTLALIGCSNKSNISTDDVACEFKTYSYDSFKTQWEEYLSKNNLEYSEPVGDVFYIEDKNIKDDEILIDVISNRENAIIAINGGDSYSDDSKKYYAPVTSLKLDNAGTYFITIENEYKGQQQWTGLTRCFELGKHYVVAVTNFKDVIKYVEGK